jgi:hypothetical protein
MVSDTATLIFQVDRKKDLALEHSLIWKLCGMLVSVQILSLAKVYVGSCFLPTSVVTSIPNCWEFFCIRTISAYTDSWKSSPDCFSTISESVFSVHLKTQVWTSSCWCTHDVDLCTQLIVCCQAVHTLCGHLLGQHINSPKILAPRKLQDTSKIAYNVFTYPLSVSSDFVVYYICKLGCY